MTWKTIFIEDSDKIGVGGTSSVFTYNDSTTFSFSQRIEGNDNALGIYAQNALAAKAAYDKKVGESITYSTKIDSILNQ